MPSCTTPTFSKIAVTSQLTQPAALAVCQASGSAVATTPALTVPCAHSKRPMAAVPTSSAAFSAVSQNWKRVITPMCAAIAFWCTSIDSRT